MSAPKLGILERLQDHRGVLYKAAELVVLTKSIHKESWGKRVIFKKFIFCLSNFLGFLSAL